MRTALRSLLVGPLVISGVLLLGLSSTVSASSGGYARVFHEAARYDAHRLVQLRDLVEFAQRQGVPLEIFTNAAALPRSGQLFNWIRRGQVIISPL